jgi:hypothetical protein
MDYVVHIGLLSLKYVATGQPGEIFATSLSQLLSQQSAAKGRNSS